MWGSLRLAPINIIKCTIIFIFIIRIIIIALAQLIKTHELIFSGIYILIIIINNFVNSVREARTV